MAAPVRFAPTIASNGRVFVSRYLNPVKKLAPFPSLVCQLLGQEEARFGFQWSCEPLWQTESKSNLRCGWHGLDILRSLVNEAVSGELPTGKMANDSETNLSDSTEASDRAKRCQALANESDEEVQGHLPEKEEAASEKTFSPSGTPSPLLDFDKETDEDYIFPEPMDPVVDDDELVDLLIEQATLLSRTIFRYLMVMP
ncbi:uncharacterized protein LOC100902740 [Galendromus occidentalis]|uniref:Uncharacterized protein LOC100902740 n=1 Tax=Galendromus occidentalis TaxID=34638 RepID=A0AAJ6QV21_9ACAR|nr:uncharacterized protein LOC100902740 [Galendromus occidentalis]